MIARNSGCFKGGRYDLKEENFDCSVVFSILHFYMILFKFNLLVCFPRETDYFHFQSYFFSTSSLRDFPHRWFSSVLTSFERICLRFYFLILDCFYFIVRLFLLGKYLGSTHLTLTKQNHHFPVRTSPTACVTFLVLQ